MNFAQYQKGFTLIELIIYIGLTAIVLFSMTAFLGLVLQSRISNLTVSEVDQQGTQVMQTITQSIRNAPNVTTPTLGMTAQTISISATDSAKNPTTFSLASGSIQMKEGTTTAIPLTTAKVIVSNFIIQNVSRATNSASLRIQYTVSFNNTSGKNEYNYSKTFYGTASLRK